MKILAALAAIAAAVTMTSEPGRAEGPQPGLWKLTTKSLIPGAPMAENSHTACITPDMVEDPGSAFVRYSALPNAAQRGCHQTHHFTGITLSWSMMCTGKSPMSGSGAMTFDSPHHYTGTFTTTGSDPGRPMTVTTTMEGQRVGECDK
jgi:hypothetical protein